MYKIICNKMKTNIHTNVIVNLIRTVVLLVLSFITFPYICRVLGDANLGIYTWANSFVYYFLILARVSIPNIATREIVKVKDDPVALSKKTQEFFIIQAITTLLSFALLCLILFTVPAFKNQTGTVYDYQPIILLLSINFLSGVFSFEWIYTALEKHVYMAIRSLVILTIVDILIFLLVIYPEYIAVYTMCTVSVTILTVISNLIYLPKLVKFKKVDKYDFKQYLKPIGVLFMITLMIALYEKSDSFILGLIDSSKVSVGSYAVGIKGVEIIIGIVTSLSVVFMPRATHYLKNNDQKNFQNLNKYSANICFFIVIPAIATMIALADPITSLISGSYDSLNTYKEAPMVLIALASMMLTYSLSNIIYTQILIPLKKEKLYIYALGIGLIFDIGLSLLFAMLLLKETPALGVAIATSIADLIVLIILCALVYKDIKRALFNWNNLKILVVGIIIFLFAFFVGPLIQGALLENLGDAYSRVVEIVAVILIGAIIYISLLLLTKEKLISTIFKIKR